MKTKVFGSLLLMEALFMLLACCVSAYYCYTEGEKDFWPLFVPALLTAAVGGGLYTYAARCKHITRQVLSRKDSFLVVALVWVIFSVFGMLPFLLYGTTNNLATAYFETMSGFTSTGATALTNIDEQPHGILFWRQLTQWLGGLGIVVFSFALIPIYELKNTNMFSAEVTGLSVDKLHPRIGDTARRLLLIYVILTCVCGFFYALGPMNVFDAICHAMTTIATGGFSTHQDSISYWQSPYIEYVCSMFMFVGSVNFSLYYFASTGRTKVFFKNEELQWFTIYVLLALVLFCSLSYACTYMPALRGASNSLPTGLEETFRSSLFHVMSITSSTGYQATHYNYVAWGAPFWMPTLILMFVGACAGSTGGGVKMIRIAVCVKDVVNQFRAMLHPHAVIPLRLSGKVLPPGKVKSALSFMFLYMLLLVMGCTILTSMGWDTDTALGSSLSCLSNIGPGTGHTGPAGTYALMSDAAKLMLSFFMLVGRLEFYTILFLFMPEFWRMK